MNDAMHPSMAALARLDLRNLDACRDILSDDFVWHYFNESLPVVDGDYRGVDRLKTSNVAKGA